ncbi:MAG: hypothetical protein RLZZ172_572 [Bacteroidota bacterium]
MKAGLRVIFLITILTLTVHCVYSQQDSLVTVHYKKTPFPQVVADFEKFSGRGIFYDAARLDTMAITFDADNRYWQQVLQEMLNSRKLTMNQYDNRLFIFGSSLQPLWKLPDGFFSGQPIKTNESKSQESVTPKKELFADQQENRLIEIGSSTSPGIGRSFTLAGYIRDARTGEGIVGASVFIDQLKQGVVSDAFGAFSIQLPAGRNAIRISSAGMKQTRRELLVYDNGQLIIELKEEVPTLKTVTIVVEKNSNVRRMQMGVEKLSAKTIKQIPVLLGEPDVLRVLLTLPGVTSVGEASTGFNVRGGSTDQNLILLNDATIFNPSHVFGFFSAFNPDQIKGAELYKSSIPERYGGRLSSVLDITTRDGNAKQWTGNAGIGPLTSKFNIEGPLVKDKTTLLAGGRSSYSDWILRRIPDPAYRNSRASFNDFNIHLAHQLGSRDNLYVTGYVSGDRFRLNNDTTFSYANNNVVAKWKHTFNNRLYMTVTAGTDQYQYQVSGDQETIKSFRLKFALRQWHGRTEFNHAIGNKHLLNAGLHAVFYRLDPGQLSPLDAISKVGEDRVNREQAREMAWYVGDKFTVNDRLSIQAGLRHSLYQFLGPARVYRYESGLPRDLSTVADSIDYNKGASVKTYQGPEFRLALRYVLGDNTSVKFGYNNLRQYIHLLTNTTAISPTDIWKLSDVHIRPQTGSQYAIGFYRDFPKQAIETSFELYYKRINNFLDYKSGAQLVMNRHVERDVLTTQGNAYGAELMVKKQQGKLNGWISYAYARILLQMKDSLAGQTINKGNPYPANFDKPHAVNLVANYKFTHRYNLSFNAQYSTGRPITLPIAIFDLAGSQRVLYSERNQYRVPDFFRADISFNIDGNHKVKQKTHNSWSLGVYNLTARKNPYSIYFVEERGVIKGYKLSVIGAAIPYITYNIRF